MGKQREGGSGKVGGQGGWSVGGLQKGGFQKGVVLADVPGPRNLERVQKRERRYKN